jgi:CHAD domain-containing protein
LEQVDKALSELNSTPVCIGGDPSRYASEAIHSARKRFKKVRAVLRLVRDTVGSTVYKRENVWYRDAGRELSSVRDAAVMVDTLDGLAEQFGDRATRYAFEGVREKLVDRYETILQRVVKDENVIAQVALTIQEGRPRIKEWPIAESGFAALRDGLKRVYKRGRKAWATARAESTTENLHELRKRAKYLWYHMRILEPCWPDLLEPFADQVHTLSDYLGDTHDLALLTQLLEEQTQELFSDEIQAAALLGLVAERWSALEAASWPLAERIYVEKAKDFVARIAGYWHARHTSRTQRWREATVTGPSRRRDRSRFFVPEQVDAEQAGQIASPRGRLLIASCRAGAYLASKVVARYQDHYRAGRHGQQRRNRVCADHKASTRDRDP